MKHIIGSARLMLVALLLTAAAACAHVPKYQEWIAACAPRELPESSPANRIYFVTSRLPDCREPQIRLSRTRTDTIRYGVVEASAPAPRSPRRGVGAPVLLEQERWLQEIRGQLGGSQSRALVYVHGFNVSFEQAVARARLLRHRTGFAGPIILFTWPSQAQVTRYTWDEENALWTQPYFDALVTALHQEPSIGDLVLVAHSMGSRILLRSLAELERGRPAARLPKVRTVILASPDVDRQVLFRDYLPYLSDGGRRTTIYASRIDQALRASWRVHGLARAGDTGCGVWDVRRSRHRRRCFIGEQVPIPANIDVIDTSLVENSDFGHADFVDSRIAAADVCHVLRSRDPPPNRERIGTRPNVYFLVRGPVRCPEAQSAE